MWILTIVMTVTFYFVLDSFNTANIVPSTISVTTSFIAVYLTFRQFQFFAIRYAVNDVVLIVLWVLVSIADARYISVVICFAAFLINDIYGFLNWRKIKERQRLITKSISNDRIFPCCGLLPYSVNVYKKRALMLSNTTFATDVLH